MYDQFFTYLGELEENFHKLSDLLKKKLVALESEDTAGLDKIIKEEQVFVLITRGFDGNIQTYRKELGVQGQRLSEIIDELPDSEQPRYRRRFRTLYAALTEAKALEDKCRGLIEERLHAIQKAVRELDSNRPSSTYNSSGAQADGKARLLTTSV